MKQLLLIFLFIISNLVFSQDTINLPNTLFPFFKTCDSTKQNLTKVQDMLGRVHFLINDEWELNDSSNVNFNYSFQPKNVKAPTEFRVKFLASKNFEEIVQDINKSTKEKGKSIEYININGEKGLIVHDSTNYICCEFPFFVKSLFIPVGKDLAVFNFSCQNRRKEDCLCQFKKIIKSIYLVPTLDISDPINLSSFQYKITSNQELRSLNPQIKSKLDSMVPFLIQNPSLKIDIGVHHTNKDYITLSTRGSMTLAFSILYYLKDNGVTNTLIPVGFGDSEPLDKTLFSPKNNRVEFKILRK